MTREAQGAVTIVDIQDGIHPISIVLSNQSHTFAADNAGVIPDAERTAFSCAVYAYIGSTRITYDGAATPEPSTYKLTTTNPAGWVSLTTITASQAVITMNSVPVGTTNKTGQIEVQLSVKNSLGNTTVVDVVISLSKAIEGAAGQIVRLTPNRQTFQFDEYGATTDGNIVIDVASEGNTGALTAQYSANGGAWSTLNVGASANQASIIDIDGTVPDTITITPANFGTSDVFSIKVGGDTGGGDTLSLIKIQDGSTGAGSLLVVINSSTGGFVFKNNTGASKTLTVTTYDMATGGTVTPSAYQWKKNGVNIATTATIIVTASDITDNSSEEYSCVVTVA